MRQDNYLIGFLLAFLSMSSTLAIPVVEEQKSVPEIQGTTPSIPTNNRLRQDEDGDGDGDGDTPNLTDAETPAEAFTALSGPISQIISGTFDGNFNQLVSGVSGTVEGQAIQPNVATILTGIIKPLTSVWAQGVAAGEKYFNITTNAPPLAAGVVVPGSLNTPVGQGEPKVQSQVVSVPAAPQPAPIVQVTYAPIVETTEEDDENESERNINSIKKVVVAV